MKESQKKAFDFAADSTKLLITLSTGIIALTITFSKDFIGSEVTYPIWPLITAWILYFLSVLFGIFTMLSLTGSLLPMKMNFDKIDEHEKKVSINEKNITFKSSVQILLFLLALFFTGIFGYISIHSKINSIKEKTEVSVNVEQGKNQDK